MNKFMTESCHVILEIRIQRKLCSDTTTSFFYFANPINKPVCNSPLEVEPAVLILASRLKVITSFFWSSQRVPRLSSAQQLFAPPCSEVCDEAHNMGRKPNKGCDFAKGQKTGCPEAIKNLNLICNFSNLSVSVCSVA